MNPGSGLLSGRRILIVEDEAIVSLMLEDLLTESGCIVIGPVGTTQSALRLIEHEPIDCAVLDVKLADGMSVPVAEAFGGAWHEVRDCDRLGPRVDTLCLQRCAGSQ